ncbi:MAG: deoxyhypusine synthase [Methanomicrobiales archaeon]|jgi:deoxyhypusine synthase|nr:deoxyhypusine synthase [Methanomicrobiales archaeon]
MGYGEQVAQVRLSPGMTVGALVEELAHAGAYNGGALARAASLYEKMVRDPTAVKFFGLAGAMVPAGMGGIVADLIARGWVDVLVSTGANLTHDILEAIGCHHYHGSATCTDEDLREEGINRIYDVFLPDRAFVHFEEFMQECYAEIAPDSPLSITGLLAAIGSRLDQGILATAARKGVPVYCPALSDSMIGLQYWLFCQTHKGFVDAFQDLSPFLDHCFSAQRAGALMVGGGVPKNFILQGMLMCEHGFSYAVQLTGDRPDLGGLSGATLDEARSWGKLESGAEAVTVYGDATITLPLLVAAVMEGVKGG